MATVRMSAARNSRSDAIAIQIALGRTDGVTAFATATSAVAPRIHASDIGGSSMWSPKRRQLQHASELLRDLGNRNCREHEWDHRQQRPKPNRDDRPAAERDRAALLGILECAVE